MHKVVSFVFFPLIFLVVCLSESVFQIFLPETYARASVYLALLSIVSISRPSDLLSFSVLTYDGTG